MNQKVKESISDYFKDDSKFIGEFQMHDYKALLHQIDGLLIISFLIRNPQLKVRGIITTALMFGFPMDRKLKGIKYITVKYFGHYMVVNNYNLVFCWIQQQIQNQILLE